MLRKLSPIKSTPIRDIIGVINSLVDGLTQRHVFIPHTAAPPELIEGMVVWADGTDWNPGSGAGLYEYRGAAWHKL